MFQRLRMPVQTIKLDQIYGEVFEIEILERMLVASFQNPASINNGQIRVLNKNAANTPIRATTNSSDFAVSSARIPFAFS